MNDQLKAICEANNVSVEAMSGFVSWMQDQLASNAEAREALRVAPQAFIASGLKFYQAEMQKYYDRLLADNAEGKAMRDKLAGEVYDELRAQQS